MAVAYDNTSSQAVTTGDQSWSHGGSASAAGALVLIVEETGTDQIVGVTYGGTAMTEIAGSPMLYAGAESGSIHGFFLNDPPTGTQDVAVDTAVGSDQWIGACFTVTSGTGYAAVHDTSTQAGTTGVTTLGATLTITTDSFVAGACYSGLGAPAFTEVSGTVSVIEGDLGQDSGGISRGTSIKTTDFAYTWTQSSDDGMALVVAICEGSAPAQTVNLPLLDGVKAIYSPTVYVDQIVTLPLIDAVGASYSATVLADSPVGYWRLGEPSGTAADNIGTAGSAIDGVYYNTPTLGVTGLLTGDSDTAVTFDGSNQWMRVDDNSALDVGDTLTIEAMARADTGSVWCPIYWKGSGTGSIEVGWSRSNTDIAVYISGVGNVASIEHVTAGTAYHLVFTKDGGSYFKIYINGVECTYTTYTAGTVVDNAQNAYWGYGPDPAYFDGTLDELALYDYALTSTQVAAHAAAATGGGGGLRIFAITVAQVAPTVTVPLIDGGAAIYSPTVTPPPFNFTVPLLDGSRAIYAPTVLAKLSLTVPLLDGAAAIYSPTVSHHLDVALPLLDGVAAIYAPTVIPPPFSLTVPLLESTPAIYSPTVALGPIAAGLPLIDANRAIYAPTVNVETDLTVPLLESTPALYAPTVNVETDVALPLLDGLAAIYSPTVSHHLDLTVPLLDGAAAIYTPTVTTTDYITLALLDGAAAIYSPTVALQGGTQALTVPLLDGAAAIYTLGVTVEQTVELPLLDASRAIYAPTVNVEQNVSLGLLDASRAIYSPTVLAVSSATLPLLDASRAIYSPTVLAVLTVSLDLRDGQAAIYAPTVLAKNTISLGLLDGSRAIYSPTVAQGAAVISLELLDAGRDIYAVTVTPPAFSLTVPLLDGLAAIYAPTVEKQTAQIIAVPLLDGEAALYKPTVQPLVVVIAGTTRNQYGAALGNCVIYVFISATNALYGQTTSDALGNYAILVPWGTEVFLVAYSAAGVYGTTARDLVGV